MKSNTPIKLSNKVNFRKKNISHLLCNIGEYIEKFNLYLIWLRSKIEKHEIKDLSRNIINRIIYSINCPENVLLHNKTMMEGKGNFKNKYLKLNFFITYNNV